MPRFMKILNNISRCQAMYRKNNLSANDLCSTHYAFVLSICRLPGHPQDELAKNLCLDKVDFNNAEFIKTNLKDIDF